MRQLCAPAPVANKPATPTRTDADSPNAALAALARFTADVCACPDTACTMRLSDAFSRRMTELASTPEPQPKPTDVEMKHATELTQQYAACLQRLRAP